MPLAEGYTVCDLAAELGLPLVIAARPGLGTINHTLLTLARGARGGARRCARSCSRRGRRSPRTIELSNRETIARLGEVEVAALPFVEGPDTAALARAGESLPWRRWLA